MGVLRGFARFEWQEIGYYNIVERVGRWVCVGIGCMEVGGLGGEFGFLDCDLVCCFIYSAGILSFWFAGRWGLGWGRVTLAGIWVFLLFVYLEIGALLICGK